MYIPAGVGDPPDTLVWVDRQGTVEPLPAPQRIYQFPRLSPDGTQIALIVGGTSQDLYVYNVRRNTLTRLTFEASTSYPLWTPDGTRLVFGSTRTGSWNMFWKPADGSGTAEHLLDGSTAQFPQDWSPDGKELVFVDNALWVLPMEGDRNPRPLLQTQYIEERARFSPDGRWLAYVSNESGRREVYVQPYPGLGGKRQISTEGGTQPVWARNGQELFYRNGERMMAVEISTQPNFSAGTPRRLFETPYSLSSSGPYANYDVSLDGKRFLMLQPVEQEQSIFHMTVVLNWFEELKQRVPTQ